MTVTDIILHTGFIGWFVVFFVLLFHCIRFFLIVRRTDKIASQKFDKIIGEMRRRHQK